MHHQLQLSFPSEELKDSFLTWLEHAKKPFFSIKSVDNAQFMNALLAKLDRLQSSLIVCELLALDKLVASIGAIGLWP